MSYHLSKIIIPNSSYEQFEETAYANPRYYRMSLVEGQLEIMPPSPVHTETDEREAELIGQVYMWVIANRNLVGKFGGSQGCYTLPSTVNNIKPTVIGPDVAVVLATRWNALTNAQRSETFPHTTPNFLIELRSKSQSPQDVHRKMLLWMNDGVEEGWSIDRFINPPEVRIYSFNANANPQITWQTFQNPQNPIQNPLQVPSQILPGLVINMQNIL